MAVVLKALVMAVVLKALVMAVVLKALVMAVVLKALVMAVVVVAWDYLMMALHVPNSPHHPSPRRRRSSGGSSGWRWGSAAEGRSWCTASSLSDAAGVGRGGVMGLRRRARLIIKCIYLRCSVYKCRVGGVDIAEDQV